ncbi:uncharacterized protein PFL1_01445 [Pseudozyma flocculosa PF-1]|uniref:Uncharacterized protein n=1 Tax=Pseudozyma flocculosa TaxID=84751 RepID=A0A5C3EYZ1_9BASI|nr:uncharacterized protein PFL1_01445 [Pseudozyma flocculosa PF-1]EPQ31260.1 hypothetical protein PFL1_01445 [Pseudozyma flocculosa PF-1]SPO36241.1 uncharacterized protein PSFLO_01712 [Pseudozyma flocculosa]
MQPFVKLFACLVLLVASAIPGGSAQRFGGAPDFARTWKIDAGHSMVAALHANQIFLCYSGNSDWRITSGNQKDEVTINWQRDTGADWLPRYGCASSCLSGAHTPQTLGGRSWSCARAPGSSYQLADFTSFLSKLNSGQSEGFGLKASDINWTRLGQFTIFG